MASEVHAVSSLTDFEKILKNSTENRLLVVHFYAPWAAQCQQIDAVLVELAKDYGQSTVEFLRIEAESLPEVSHRFDIKAVPTCVLIKNKLEVDRVNGADAAELTRKVQQWSPPGSKVVFPATTNNGMSTKDGDLTSRLKALVSRAPVMIFIKGNPEQPKCGFTRTLLEILKQQNVSFDSFDILGDEDVRQGLKEYSNWPTFPQVYVKGELVGGLDIVKELVASGEFQAMIPKPAGDDKVQPLEERLKQLINQSNIMLFMKGSPEMPLCGFSKAITEILNSKGIQYGHFDILQDQEVRDGLKAYQNWPTYPQLYVHGELQGGLDIVKELEAAGELDALLKGAEG